MSDQKPRKIVEVITPEAFGRRARQARAARELRRAHSGGIPTPATTIAEEVSELAGESVSSGDVGRWFAGKAVPGTVRRQWAFALVLDADPGWMVFGSECAAPGPSALDALPPAPLEEMPRQRKAATKRKRG